MIRLINCIILVASVLVSGCGQSVTGTGEIVINSLFLNVTNEIIQADFPISTDLLAEATEDLNFRSNENILYRPPYRPTLIKYGPLSEGVLGLTECEYRSNGTSRCTITLSPVVNPDTATTELQRAARVKAFIGVLRHELGHAFGLGHIKDDQNHVMHPYFNPSQLEEKNVEKFIIDLTNFRINGEASGLPQISTK